MINYEIPSKIPDPQESDNIAAMKSICAAWSEAIDHVKQAMTEYYAARTAYRKHEKELCERQIRERLHPSVKEWRETTDAAVSLIPKIDELNEMLAVTNGKFLH
jgi:hypothetical protein